ncbi:MAG: PLDc N-terminal domain-containing protein [Phycisphaerales bacterium]
MSSFSGGGYVIIGLLALLVIVKFTLAAGSLIHLFRTSRPTQEKLLWLLVILLIPVVGPILYITFGRKSAAA